MVAPSGVSLADDPVSKARVEAGRESGRVAGALHSVYAIAVRGDLELLCAVLRILPPVFLSGMLLVVASRLHGTAKLMCWGVAAAVDYLGPLIGHMRGWRPSPNHFVERFGQIILIALGNQSSPSESAPRDSKIDPGLITALLLGITVVACLWWVLLRLGRLRRPKPDSP